MGKKAKKSRKNRQKIDGKKDTSEEKTIEHSEVETSEPEEALHSVETSKQTKVDDSNDEVLPPTEEDENDGDEEKKDEDEEENLKEAQKKGMDEEEGDTNESRTSTKSIMESEHKEGSISDGKYRNKQRCLVVCSRGIIARYRHLLEDMRTLIPHHKKESKLDPPTSKGGFSSAINDMCQLRSCNSVLFLECRKRRDCYMWLGCTPSGPSARFHVTNIHTMDELRLTGNCMKGSRPVLTFDESFGRIPHLKLLKELFVRTLGTPRGHPKSKPFVDRVMGFYFADNKIWVRNYQVVEEVASTAKEAQETKKETGESMKTSLVEIGPRFVLDPIRVFRGSFGGQTLYQNPHYQSPNDIRAEMSRKRGRAYKERKDWEAQKKVKNQELGLPVDPLADVFR